MVSMVFVRYILVAGVAYGIDFGGYIFLLHLGYKPVIANMMIKVVAAIFGFFSHRYFTYSIKERNEIGKHAVRYFGLALFYTPVSSVMLFGIMKLLPNPVYAKFISDVLLFLFMYLITSKFTFTKPDAQLSNNVHGPRINIKKNVRKNKKVNKRHRYGNKVGLRK